MEILRQEMLLLEGGNIKDVEIKFKKVLQEYIENNSLKD